MIWAAVSKTLNAGRAAGPPSISRAGVGAWMMPATSSAPVLSQVRQAYFGRRVTITVTLAGTLSSRWEVSSPITCSAPPQRLRSN
jgi:hypothetical protein